jgi:hypothetical protein
VKRKRRLIVKIIQPHLWGRLGGLRVRLVGNWDCAVGAAPYSRIVSVPTKSSLSLLALVICNHKLYGSDFGVNGPSM